MSKVWMEVDRDDLALPIAVANSAAELARIVGTTENVIRSSICHDREDGRPPKYVCVTIEEDKDV